MEDNVMHIGFLRSTLAGIALSLAIGAGAAFAQTVNVKADLKGSNEVPPNNSSATGSMTGTFDPASKKLTYTVNYSGLTGNPTGAHFHGPADPDKNAGVAVPIQGNLGVSPIRGEATLTDAQAADMQGGKWYVNLHTAAHPGGEIRGQVTK
jgi:hypothetical protein